MSEPEERCPTSACPGVSGRVSASSKEGPRGHPGQV